MIKKHKSNLKVILLTLLCLSLNSCLSIDRKIKINKDGSGEETLTIIFMKDFYSMMSSMTSFMDSTRKNEFLDSLYSDEIFVNKTRSKYDSISGIKVIDINSKTNSDSSKSFVIKYEFDSLNKIGSLLGKTVEADDENEGNAVVTMNNKGDEIVFNYVYEQTEADAMSGNDSLNEQMKTGIAQLFGNGFIEFEIEFPYEVISSNATSTNGSTLKWNYSMSEVFLNGKLNLEAIMIGY